MTAEMNQVVADHPAIARKLSIGTSYEGRDLLAVKISDNVGTDEDEPEVLFNAHQHAREHLTVEMALYLLHLLTDNYGTDSRITNIVNTREIWIVPDMNPDGGEYDIATGTYRSWRKNRQPNPARRNVGTDLNRNWGYKWGCCGGSSGTTSVETYRGPSAFSAPETQARARLRQQPGGRRRAADQGQHRLPHLLASWCCGRTATPPPTPRPGMNADEHDTLRAPSASRWPPPTATRPEQASDLYITDGDDHRLAVGHPPDLRLHLRDVPAARPAAAASTRPTR